MTEDSTAQVGSVIPDLVAFLHARLQDDWNHARDAMTNDGQWRAERTVVVLDTGAEIQDVYLGPADHIARFDPARIVAEVAAKRALVDTFEAAIRVKAPVAYRVGLHKAVALLASVYHEHADYRAEWQPATHCDD